MNNALVEVTGLPAAPIDAAAAFHRDFVDQIRRYAREGDVVVVFDHADHDHRAWRLAAVQELAREAAPHRVNGVEGEDVQQVSETLFYLQSASGVTGQLLELARTSD
ncbi:MAG: hypothetical protein KDE15_04940 [Erythrobacter sp.]|nr:hypothetical protein [Erythrobacter sp.]